MSNPMLSMKLESNIGPNTKAQDVERSPLPKLRDSKFKVF